MNTQHTEIRQAWLMWIGESHYPTFEDFAEEARVQGVSKRVSSPEMARTIMEDGNVVFLAHDDGVKEPCPECMETFACPDCTRITDAPKGKVLRGRGVKRKPVDCERCEGTGQVTEGTGGTVYVNRKRTTYKSYVGKMRHGLIGDDDLVRLVMQCEPCSGTGSTPRGRLCGLFIPQSSEYILNPGDEAKALRLLRKAGIQIVTPGALAKEPHRKCGRRAHGGTYIVTDPRTRTGKTNLAANFLIDQGLAKHDGVEVRGAFASFIKPIPIVQKRFRGIKKITFPTRAAAPVLHVFEAIA